MRELFFTLGVLALFRLLDFGWWGILIVICVLFYDFLLISRNKREQAELEAFKLLMKEKK